MAVLPGRDDNEIIKSRLGPKAGETRLFDSCNFYESMMTRNADSYEDVNRHFNKEKLQPVQEDRKVKKQDIKDGEYYRIRLVHSADNYMDDSDYSEGDEEYFKGLRKSYQTSINGIPSEVKPNENR